MNLSELQEILSAIIQGGVDESNVIDRIENQLKEQDFDIIFSNYEMDVKTILLHVAASMDRLKIVEYLVGKKNVAIDLQNTNDNTPLHSAVRKNNFSIVEYLIKNGADIKAEGQYKNTPLHYAAAIGHVDIVNTLIDKGAEVNAKNSLGKTPLHSAASREVVNALIDKKADINARDNYGCTSLHNAVIFGCIEVVNALIDKKADINARDNYGCTPLHNAVIFGCIEVVNALIDKKADINAVDSCGWIPLRWALGNGYKNVVKVLIQKTLIQNSSVQKPDYLTGAYSTYWNEYKNKIEGKIGNSNTSYLDLLKADEDETATHVMSDKLKKAIDKLNYEGEFSALESQIRNKFNKGIERRELMNDGTRVIQRFDCVSNIKLNSEVSEEIAFYLPNSDLKKLKDIGDNNKNAHVKPSTKIDETREKQGITGNGRKV